MKNEQLSQRVDKVEELRKKGINPYRNDFKPTHLARDLIDQFSNLEQNELEKIDSKFYLAGRLTSERNFGKSIFFHINDFSGKIQGYIRNNIIGKEKLEFFNQFIDIGDFIGIVGNLFKTKTGELTINITDFVLLSKSLHPLPEKWHGLQDVETRYRQRYLDLISNEQIKEIFYKRSKIIRLIRDYLDKRGFIEVETPILHPIAGGAAARPFKTFHNALDMEFYLRIAPELYLKRLVVGGLEKVYEIGRTFRNEGVSTQHNPEFTILELYQSYATYEDLMELIEEMICSVAKDLTGVLKLEYFGKEINLSRPWKRVDMLESLVGKFGKRITIEDEYLFNTADSFKISHNGVRGKAILELFEIVFSKDFIDPTYVLGFPLDISPLARRNDSNPEITDRFELYVSGKEIANAFSELNDPIDQRERFNKQLELKLKGEDEAHEMDEDFLTALEYGMPPTAGAGIGIDRLVMLFTNSSSIREVIFFPHLRPENTK